MTQNIQPKPLGFVMADGIADALFGRRIVRGDYWTPLVKLVGETEFGDFMFMGNDGDLMLYKHINSRRYLNINRISGRTFQFVSCPRGYKAVPADEALAYVRAL